MGKWTTGVRGWLTALIALVVVGALLVALGYFSAQGPVEETKRELAALVPGFDALQEGDRAGLVRAAIRCPGLRAAEFESCIRDKADVEFKARLQVLLVGASQSAS